MTRIVILDGYAVNPGDLSWDRLRNYGELAVYERTSNDMIAERIGDSEIVLTNKTPITYETMRKCTNIKYIGLLATGYDVVDIQAARERYISVSNIPAYGTAIVGQFAIALLLEICHNIGHHNLAVHDGRWENNNDWCFWDYPQIELTNKTMGIIGFGRIGQTTAKIAESLGMRILAHDKLEKSELIRHTCKYATLDELLFQSDIIVLHCPLLPETKNIINKHSINKMKNGVIIINNSRGGLIEENDLAAALNSGKVYAAGIDVASTEPILSSNPLLYAKNCIITPHISWASKESRQKIISIAEDNLKNFLCGTPVNLVS